MPTVTTSTSIPILPIREGSRYRSARDRDDVRQVRKQVNPAQEQLRSVLQSQEQLARKIEAIRRRILGGSGGTIQGWFFGNGGNQGTGSNQIELPSAPYPAYQAQQVINIQPTLDIVTTGIADLANPTGGLVTSCPGLWVATQAVPAQTTVGGTDCWNLPQFPIPVPTNCDDPKNFWLYLGQVS